VLHRDVTFSVCMCSAEAFAGAAAEVARDKSGLVVCYAAAEGAVLAAEAEHQARVACDLNWSTRVYVCVLVCDSLSVWVSFCLHACVCMSVCARLGVGHGVGVGVGVGVHQCVCRWLCGMSVRVHERMGQSAVCLCGTPCRSVALSFFMQM
jgi:hypothetical protein